MSVSRTNQAGRGRRGRLLPLVLGLLVAVPTSVSAEETDTLETIRSALREWRSRFSNVRIKYRFIYGSEVPDSPPYPYHNEYEHLLTDGVHCWVDTHAFVNHRETSRLLLAFAPERSFMARWRDGRMVSLGITGGSTLPSGMHTSQCIPLSYLLLPGYGMLADVLTEESVRVVEAHAELNHRPVVRVELSWWVLPEQTIRFWLDPAQEYLPVQVETDGATRRRTIDVFRKVSGAGPMPDRGTLWYRSEPHPFRWEVTELEVNTPIDARLFIPPKPEVGTLYQPLGQPERIYGGETLTEATTAIAALPPSAGNVVRAHGPNLWEQYRSSLALLGLAVLLVVLTRHLSRRSRTG